MPSLWPMQHAARRHGAESKRGSGNVPQEDDERGHADGGTIRPAAAPFGLGVTLNVPAGPRPRRVPCCTYTVHARRPASMLCTRLDGRRSGSGSLTQGGVVDADRMRGPRLDGEGRSCGREASQTSRGSARRRPRRCGLIGACRVGDRARACHSATRPGKRSTGRYGRERKNNRRGIRPRPPS